MAKKLESDESRLWRKTIELRTKNRNLKALNRTLHKRIAKIEKGRDFAHIIKIPQHRIWYIDVGVDREHCSVCLKKRKTTAHHMIPIRADCKNKMLRELRIRACNKCEKKLHPENALMPNRILKRKDKMIKDLQNKLKVMENDYYHNW